MITRLMETQSGARVVKGSERDHATRRDSSKNRVTRKSMLVKRAHGRTTHGKRAGETRQKDRAHSRDRCVRPPTPYSPCSQDSTRGNFPTFPTANSYIFPLIYLLFYFEKLYISEHF